jgi:hypothetical protein
MTEHEKSQPESAFQNFDNQPVTIPMDLKIAKFPNLNF